MQPFNSAIYSKFETFNILVYIPSYCCVFRYKQNTNLSDSNRRPLGCETELVAGKACKLLVLIQWNKLEMFHNVFHFFRCGKV